MLMYHRLLSTLHHATGVEQLRYPGNLWICFKLSGNRRQHGTGHFSTLTKKYVSKQEMTQSCGSDYHLHGRGTNCTVL